jgi:hypothetical protein
MTEKFNTDENHRHLICAIDHLKNACDTMGFCSETEFEIEVYNCLIHLKNLPGFEAAIRFIKSGEKSEERVHIGQALNLIAHIHEELKLAETHLECSLEEKIKE